MSSPAPYSIAGTPRPSHIMDEPDSCNNALDDVPKRTMRVKILYTIGGSEKGHLVRLPKAFAIPVATVDDGLEVGAFHIKTVIDAVVASSPELITEAKCEFNVYSIDFAEYNSPRTSQGMLSKLLAAFATGGEALDSEGMIVGRVCKNIMGLFSNGIKETLEVKLELQPIEQFSRSDFIRNIDAYRQSKGLKPLQGDFAYVKPTVGSPDDGILAPVPHDPRSARGGIEAFHNVLTARTPTEEDYSGLPPQAYHGSRAPSPTFSQRSGYVGGDGETSRPNSRMSQHAVPFDNAFDEQEFEEGPARKRARLTQADWRGRGSFGSGSDSLRVAVSTSASIREFRPINAANPALQNDLVPRAPTPRAAEKRPMLARAALANSTLRRQSTVSEWPSPPSEGNTPQPDSGIYMDDSGLGEPSPASPDIPSSPPELFRNDSMPPSSPGLPELPSYFDSGFNSEAPDSQPQQQERAKTPTPPALTSQQIRIREKNSKMQWTTVKPGPTDKLPTSTQRSDSFGQSQSKALAAVASSNPRKKGLARTMSLPAQSVVPAPAVSELPMAPHPEVDMKESAANTVQELRPLSLPSVAPAKPQLVSSASLPAEARPSSPLPVTVPSVESQRHNNALQAATNPATANTHPKTLAPAVHQSGPLTTSIQLPPRTITQGRWNQGSRAQSWAAGCSSDVDSDGGTERKGRKGTNGSGLQLRGQIERKLEAAVLAGAVPRYCMNCGDIKPSTWRCYWIKEDLGSGSHIELGQRTGIHWIEPLEKDDVTGAVKKHRVYKQWSHLSTEERESGDFQQLIFCNPCGDYIRKYRTARPEQFWTRTKEEKAANRKKRKAAAPRPVQNKKSKVNGDMPPPSSDIFTDNMPFLSSDIFTDAAHAMFTDPSSIIPTCEPTPQHQSVDMSNWPDFNFDFGALTPPEANANTMPPKSGVSGTTSSGEPTATATPSYSPTATAANSSMNLDGSPEIQGITRQPTNAKIHSGCPASGNTFAAWDTTSMNFNAGMPAQDNDLPSTQQGTPIDDAADGHHQVTAPTEKEPKRNPVQIKLVTPSKAKPINRVLFPSPRRPGEFRSLDGKSSPSPSPSKKTAPSTPSTPLRRSPRKHNTRTPGGRDITISEAIVPTSVPIQPPAEEPEEFDLDKENQLPSLPFTPRKFLNDGDDGLGYLFGDGSTPRKTPAKMAMPDFDFDLPKPTPRTQKLIDALLSDAPDAGGFEGLGSPGRWGIGE